MENYPRNLSELEARQAVAADPVPYKQMVKYFAPGKEANHHR
jgi:hypothetical protein